MPNKKSEKNKLKFTNSIKKVLAATLITTMGMSSGAIFSSLNSQSTYAMAVSSETVAADSEVLYINDTDAHHQSRRMMDGNNYLLDGYWMQANLTRNKGLLGSRDYSAVLRFTIPGYNPLNLKFYLLNKDASKPIELTEHVLSSSAGSCGLTLNLSGLTSTSYEVHVYNGSLARENFVSKAEFTCVDNYSGWGVQSTGTTSLLGASGAQINAKGWGPLRLDIASPSQNRIGSNQFLLALPTTVVPYNARTVKVVFFASDRNGAPVNIDKNLYDYVYRAQIFGSDSSGSAIVDPGVLPDGGEGKLVSKVADVAIAESFINPDHLVFAPDAQSGIDPSVKYEAHFYKDEVAPQNFICKAVDITNRDASSEAHL